MRRTPWVAVWVGLLAVGLFAVDASAMYHPGLGRFTSRDPGPGGATRVGGNGPIAAGTFVPRDATEEYADGMTLYQYVGGNPVNRLDHSGLKWGMSDFVRHYWTGGGKSVDLEDVGLLEDWKSEVATGLKGMEMEIFLTGRPRERPCEADGTFIKFDTSGRVVGKTFTASATDRHHNVLDPLYSLGASTVLADYRCTITGKCECCKGSFKEVSRTITCEVHWTLDDSFANPMDKGGAFYERDEQAYRRCTSFCDRTFGVCRDRGTRWGECMVKHGRCLKRCDKRYPASELPLAQKYKIAASWDSTITKTVESPCE